MAVIVVAEVGDEADALARLGEVGEWNPEQQVVQAIAGRTLPRFGDDFRHDSGSNLPICVARKSCFLCAKPLLGFGVCGVAGIDGEFFVDADDGYIGGARFAVPDFGIFLGRLCGGELTSTQLSVLLAFLGRLCGGEQQLLSLMFL